MKVLAFLEEERKGVRFGNWTAHEVEVSEASRTCIGRHASRDVVAGGR